MQLNLLFRAVSSVCKGNADFVTDFRAFLKQSIQQRGCAVRLHRLSSAAWFIVITVPVTCTYVSSLGCSVSRTDCPAAMCVTSGRELLSNLSQQALGKADTALVWRVSGVLWAKQRKMSVLCICRWQMWRDWRTGKKLRSCSSVLVPL